MVIWFKINVMDTIKTFTGVRAGLKPDVNSREEIGVL